MENSKLINILDRYFKTYSRRDFNGIEVYPEIKDDLIYIKFNNPSDLSYNPYCITDFFYTQFETLCKLLHINPSPYFNLISTKYLVEDLNKVYINKTDKKNLSKILSGLSKKIYTLDSVDIDVLLEFTKFQILPDPENITIEVFALEHDCSDYDELSYWYFNSDDYQSESYQIITPIVDYIGDKPHLYNDSYMYMNTNIVIENIESYEEWNRRVNS
jgi:hypothetical protein